MSSDFGSDVDEVDDDPVLLGFVQRPISKLSLARDRFPSKVGGFPAWLDPEHVPEASHLTCSRCERVMRFLAQIYAPIDDIDEAFHRTLFVFCCVTPSCSDSTSRYALPPESTSFLASESPLDLRVN